jgi:hypothetical protein
MGFQQQQQQNLGHDRQRKWELTKHVRHTNVRRRGGSCRTVGYTKWNLNRSGSKQESQTVGGSSSDTRISILDVALPIVTGPSCATVGRETRRLLQTVLCVANSLMSTIHSTIPSPLDKIIAFKLAKKFKIPSSGI